MIELTGADLADIERIRAEWRQSWSTEPQQLDDMLAKHFLAAGIERAANICGEYAYDKRAAPELRGNSNGAADCAAAIRALLK